MSGNAPTSQPASYRDLMGACRPSGLGTAFGFIHPDTLVAGLEPLYARVAELRQSRSQALTRGSSDEVWEYDARIEILDEAIAVVETAIQKAREEAEQHGHHEAPRGR